MIHNLIGTKISFVASIVLSVIAIGLVPCVFFAATNYLFGYPVPVGAPTLGFVYAPLAATLIGILSLILAIVGRRYYRFGWILIIFSCIATVFPVFYVFATLRNWF